MTARYEAEAYVELADATIRRAWRYQQIWAALEAGRCPPKLIREVLDRRLVEQRTEAVEAIDEWAESASDVPKIVAGGVGRGKSFAAARWLARMAERGLSVAWLSAKELGRLPFERDHKREADREITTLSDEERRALKACAVVLDDLRAGLLHATILSRINGLLLELEEHGTPVLILLNDDKDAKWAEQNIDPRIFDRMRTRGVKISRLARGKSLRGTTDSEKVDDKRGRGGQWFATASMLRDIGVIDTFDNTAWLPDQKRAVLQPEFGHALCGHAGNPNWPTLLVQLCRVASLDVAAVKRRANELSRLHAQFRAQIEDADVDLGGDRGHVRGASGFMAHLLRDIEQDRGRHNKPMRAGDVLTGETERPPPVGPEPTFVDGERQRLFAFGYRVHHCVIAGEFELRHTRPGTNGRDPKRSKQRLLGTYETEARAWDAARKLTAVEKDGSWKTEKATA